MVLRTGGCSKTTSFIEKEKTVLKESGSFQYRDCLKVNIFVFLKVAHKICINLFINRFYFGIQYKK